MISGGNVSRADLAEVIRAAQCDALGSPFRWSTHDTDKTIERAREHNAVWTRLRCVEADAGGAGERG